MRRLHAKVLLANFLRASDVQKRIRVAVKPENFLFAKAVAFAIRIITAKSPTITKPMRFEGRHDGVQVASDIRRELLIKGS
jgi:hypothetical protein